MRGGYVVQCYPGAAHVNVLCGSTQKSTGSHVTGGRLLILLALHWHVVGLGAQQDGSVTHLRTALVDFAVVRDTLLGVGLFAVPSPATVQNENASTLGMWFHPDSLKTWLETAPAYLTDRATVGDGLPSVRWIPALRSTSSDSFSAGRKTAQVVATWEHYVAVDNASEHWRAQVTSAELRQLFVLLFEAAAKSHWSDLVTTQPGGVEILSDKACAARPVERPAAMLTKPSLTHPAPGHPGTVFLQYIVDTNGRVDPTSILVLSTTGDAYTREARRSVEKLKFIPAYYCGQLVRQQLQQRVTFE